ncbi:MAG: protein kinase [Enhydrobacter sp.]|nr:MAG: protein kinase [Enhydrobacter sp.]
MKEPTTDPNQPAAQAEHDFAALPVGARVGRYEITAILGQGGFGITYRARDEQLGREVAIKEYLPSALAVRQDGSTVLPRSTKVAEDFGWGRERFVSEGRTLASLHDAPGIVRVFDFMEMNGTAYIVMELVRGDTLEGLLKQKGKLSPGEVEFILGPLLDGLEKVHETGFLHRDIKPANILLRPDGKPTLIDFGASRAAMAGRTTAMTAIFTPGYAAAEQFTSARQGPWTDIYGLSATLYHAITGAAPPSAFDRMLDDEYKPLTSLAPPAIQAGFKPGLLIGIDSGLAVRASERPQSIAGWRPLLTQASAGAADATVALGRQPDPNVTIAVPRAPQAAPSTQAPTQVPTQVPTQAPAPPVAPTVAPAAAAPAKSRIGLYAGVAVVALLVLAGGGYALLGGKSAPPTASTAPPAAPAPPQAVALQDMKVEELEKVLEARRRAEAEAAEKRRLEEEAKQKAEADSEAKRKADDELTRAEDQRKKAEEELARLQAELETQRKAAAEQREIAEAQAKRIAAEEARRKIEAEMAALRATEDEARRKAAIEAEAKRLADEALAKAAAERARAEAEAKARADAEAKQKAEADAKTRLEAEARAKVAAEKEKVEAEAKAKADAEAKAKADAEAKAKLEADKKGAEAAEAALRLTTQDRQRLQVALTALGFNTGGSDGAFGPRSRAAISAWQKKNDEAETGFLTASQQQALLKDAAPAVAKFDEDLKKAVFDGTYGGALAAGGGVRPTTVRVAGGAGSGTFSHPRCGDNSFTFTIAATGEISGSGQRSDPNCAKVPATVSGRAANNQLQLVIAGSGMDLAGTVTLGAAPPSLPQASQQQAPQQQASQQQAAAGAGSFDGTYGGTLNFAGAGGMAFGSGPRSTTIRIAGNVGTGTTTVQRCGASPLSIRISPAGEISGDARVFDQNCSQLAMNARGRAGDGQLQLDFSGAGGELKGTLRLGAAAPAAAAAPSAPSPGGPSATGGVANVYDGRWSGLVTTGAGGQIPLSSDVRNGRGTSSWYNQRCNGTVNVTVQIDPAGTFSLTLDGPNARCQVGTSRFAGSIQGNKISVAIAGGAGSIVLSK